MRDGDKIFGLGDGDFTGKQDWRVLEGPPRPISSLDGERAAGVRHWMRVRQLPQRYDTPLRPVCSDLAPENCFQMSSMCHPVPSRPSLSWPDSHLNFKLSGQTYLF